MINANTFAAPRYQYNTVGNTTNGPTSANILQGRLPPAGRQGANTYTYMALSCIISEIKRNHVYRGKIWSKVSIFDTPPAFDAPVMGARGKIVKDLVHKTSRCGRCWKNNEYYVYTFRHNKQMRRTDRRTPLDNRDRATKIVRAPLASSK